MGRRFVGIAAVAGTLLAVALPASAGASEALASAAATKTKLVVKLRGDERLPVKSRFEPNPPTIVLEFPSGRVAGTLPERSPVGQGAIREIRTSYQPNASAEGRWIKTLSVELSGRYSYAVRQDGDQIIVEVEHPADIAQGALQVGLATGTVIAGQAPAQERFRAMQDALSRATAKPSAASSSTTDETQARQPLSQPLDRPTVATPGRPTTPANDRAKLTAGRRTSLPLAVWGLLIIGLAGGFGTIIWAARRQSGPFMSRRRVERSSLAIDVIDQLVWRAFEQQGGQLQQILQGSDGTGPLRIMAKDGAKIGLQCIGGGAFFEKASVERFNQALKDAGVEQGYLVAAGAFTVPAQRFAKDHQITLIGREPLTELLGAGAGQEHYAKQLQEINGQLQKTRETLDEYARQLDMIRRQRNEACWLLGEERAKLAKIESEFVDLRQQAEQWRTDVAHWEQTAKLNHRKWEESQWYLGESRAFAEHLESQLQPLQESSNQLEQRATEATEALANMTRLRDESQWYLNETRTANAALEEQVREVEQRLGELQGRLKQVEGQLEESQRSLAAERMERERLQERLATFQMVGERRRTSRRYLKDSAVSLHTSDGTLLYQGVPRDISGEGVGISCDKTVPLPEQASLRVEFLNGDQVLETEGRLVWNREAPDGSEQWSGYEFVDLPEEIRRAIEQLLTLPN